MRRPAQFAPGRVYRQTLPTPPAVLGAAGTHRGAAMTDQPSLRQRVARAIHRYDNHHALCGNDVLSQHHLGEADAVLAELRAELEAASVVGPAADRAALRDRIRRALCEAKGEGFMWGTDMLEPDEYGDVADAVLSVLPAPADRAAVLEEAADRYQGFLDNADTSADPRYWTGIRDMVIGLRHIAAGSAVVDRVAAETPPAVPGTRVCAHCGDPITAPAAWISRPAVDGQRYYHLTVPACRAAACPDAETPPAETLAAAVASCPGYETSPNLCRCPCYGCKHHCSAHDPHGGAFDSPPTATTPSAATEEPR